MKLDDLVLQFEESDCDIRMDKFDTPQKFLPLHLANKLLREEMMKWEIETDRVFYCRDGIDHSDNVKRRVTPHITIPKETAEDVLRDMLKLIEEGKTVQINQFEAWIRKVLK